MRAAALVASLLLLVSASSTAFAQSDKDTARELANQGFAFFQKGQYAEAYAAFKKAEEKFHAPTILLLEARAAEKLGKNDIAKDLYLKVASEILDLSAPPEFAEAQKQARESLAAMDASTGGVVIVVRGTSPRRVSLEVDGKPTTLPAPGQALALPPGKHVLVGSTSGGGIVSRSVTITGGQKERVELLFEAVPGDPDAPPAPVTPPVKNEAPELGEDAPVKPPPPKPVADGPSLAPGVAGMIVGGVGLGVGIVAGINVLSRTNDLKERCHAGICPQSDAGKADSARSLATVSTVAFVAGGVLLGAGGVYLLVQTQSKKGAKPAPGVGLALGTSSANVWGRF